MTTLMQASNQWATRPDDERFTSLTALNDYCQRVRSASRSAVLPSFDLEAQPLAGDVTHSSLVVHTAGGETVAPTHWAFGQMAERAKAPAAYLRGLPAPLAADCINYGLRYARDVEDLGVLFYKGEDNVPQLKAVTGPQYGRVWNSTITQALVDRFGDGLTGHFRVPGEFGKEVDVTKRNTTLFASDRDMFVFLADEKRRIEMPDRRNGQSGSLARGFFVWNSETGGRSYGIGMFLFDYVCCNRIVWGAEGYTEIRGRHTVSAPQRWIDEIAPAIEAYAESSAAPVEAKLLAAQKKKVDDLDDFLSRRFSFTKAQIGAIKTVHQLEEARPIETIWDTTTAITAYARGLPHQDARIELERKAGRILDLAA